VIGLLQGDSRYIYFGQETGKGFFILHLMDVMRFVGASEEKRD